MKKFMLFAMVAIGMASCANDEDIIKTDASSPISFKAVTQKASRSALTASVLTDQTNVYVTGVQHDGEKSSFRFTNALFSGTSNQFSSGNPDASWPATGTMDFWAYSCSDYTLTNGDNSSSTTTENRITPVSSNIWGELDSNGAFTTMTLDFANALNGQTDVMYSDVIAGKDCSSKEVFYLNFRHALSWIIFNIDSNTGVDNLYIYSITLKNVMTSGKLVVTNTANGSSTEWTPYIAPGQSVAETKDMQFEAFTSYTGLNISTAKSADLKGLLILPQEETEIEIKYAFEANATTFETKTFDLSTESKHNYWRGGNKYTYYLKFNSTNNISFNTSVTPFEGNLEDLDWK